jgi:TPR repeat protein
MRPIIISLRLLFICLVFATTNILTAPAFAATVVVTESLPLEVQIDLLIEELSKRRELDDHLGVIDVIGRIRALNAPFPDFLYWVEAQALNGNGQILEARDRLLAYLSKTGRDGRFYRQASELLVAISAEADRLERRLEEQRKQREIELAIAEKKAMLLRTQDAQRYLDQLGFPLVVTGELNQQTREAVAVYQIRRGLKVNAEITDEVIDMLRSEVPDQHLCDELAHYSLGPTDWEIVEIEDMDATQALTECNQALRLYPEVIRFQIQYARALAAADRGDEAILTVGPVVRKGYPAAEYEMGQLYLKGQLSDTGKPDYRTALRMFNYAAEKDYAAALFQLGMLYEKGSGVQRDSVSAIQWYLKAAELGFAPAQVATARLYLTGRGVKKNYEKAIKWYTRAAEAGYAEGQYRLGELYERGSGVKRNKQTALSWYTKASAQGHREAKAKVKRLR